MSIIFIQKNLWMGSTKAIHQPATLYDRGVRAVLRLDNSSLSWLDHFEVHHMPFVSELSITAEQIREGLAFIQGHLAEGRGVLVQGQTGETLETIFVMAYLMEAERLDLADAFTRVMIRHSDAMPPPEPLQTLDALYRTAKTRWDLTQPHQLGILLSTSQSRVHRILPGLYLGGIPTMQREAEMRAIGIEAVLRLDRVPREKGQWSADFTLLDMAIPDKTLVAPEKISSAAAFIHQNRSAGRGVLAHCQMGASRSPLMVMAYLIEYQGLNLAEALSLVRRRPIVQPAPIMIKSLILHYHLPYNPDDVFKHHFFDDLSLK